MISRAVPLGLTLVATVSLTACIGGGVNGFERMSSPNVPTVQPVQATRASTPRPATFDAWIAGFRPRALSQGISPAVFDRAMSGIGYAEDSITRDRSQAEFTRPIWQYLDGAVSDTRIENGQRMLREHARTLAAIEARYNVEREVVVAIWGLESSYGNLRGRTPIIETLATLAYEGRRAAFFEQQLVAALQILQAGDVTPERMVGSWAGAMGHTQFIPTSYLAYAVDFNGDGRRDIWSDDPTDALASAAAYLARMGWTRGQPWGVEVRLPAGFNPRLAGTRRPVSEWRGMGVQAQRGSLPATGEATLMFPAGANGPALLAFQNFRVIKRYNNSDSYVIAIGHLSDRLRGGGAFVAPWPRDDRPLTRDEREELQRLLTARGYDTGGVDGRVGPATVAAVQAWQQANGLTPDGYVSLDLLQRLRRR
jgi:membrane-bound lytic murein transglycosylase B